MTLALTPVARRMRRYRERIREQRIVVSHIQLDETVKDFLVAAKLLPHDCDDPAKIRLAIEQHFANLLKDLEQST